MKNEFVGFTQGFHTESLSIIKDDVCYFYPKHIDTSLVSTDEIAFYEKPFLKRTRQFYAGQYRSAFKSLDLKLKPKYFFEHHMSHAANAFQTSTYDDAQIVVADSIGEWDTLSVWNAKYVDGKAQYEKMYCRKYPFSFGLFYSSIVQLVGMKPNKDENTFMYFSKEGNVIPKLLLELNDQLEYNNNHRGFKGHYEEYDSQDLATTCQVLLELKLEKVFSSLSNTNLCFSGGVAFNKFAVYKLKRLGYNIFVPKNPGDPGSAIGAAGLLYRKRIENIVEV